jgi:hypothetical protein
MVKKIAMVAVLVAAMAFAVGAFAGAGCCKGAMKAPDGKTCPKMAQGCPHQAEMQAAYKALEADLAEMEKGVPEKDQAAFMKAHQEHLKKLLDSRAACMKECPMKMQSKEAPKTEAKASPEAGSKG